MSVTVYKSVCNNCLIPSTMIPAYKVSAEDLMEIAYAISQVGPNTSQEEIQRFTNLSERRVSEGIKTLKELEIIKGNDTYSVNSSYRKKLDGISIENRSVLMNRALIQYRPFRTFGAYLRKGYDTEDAARKTNVVHNIASDSDYIIDYFQRLGEYAGIVETDDDSLKVKIEGREIPVDSVQSVEALRNALNSEAEIRFWMEETIGPEIIATLDEDTEDELVKAFSEHADSPRDSITASGRALEDFLREICRKEGIADSRLESAGGAAEVADILRSESLIRKVHNKRAHSLSAIRNKGGAHGDDRQTGDRWRTEAELALTVAMETTLLISSVSQLLENGNQVL